MQLPKYKWVLEYINTTNRNLPAILHGYVCGLICGSSDVDNSSLFQLLLHKLELENLGTKTAKEFAARLILTSFKNLQSDDYSFQLLLPTDDQLLESRVSALSEWCDNFISGFSDSGLEKIKNFNNDVTEAFNDLSIIGHKLMVKLNDDKSNENYYIQIVEHVRVSVLLIYTECVFKGSSKDVQDDSKWH